MEYQKETEAEKEKEQTGKEILIVGKRMIHKNWLLLGLFCLLLAVTVDAESPPDEPLIFDFFVCNPS